MRAPVAWQRLAMGLILSLTLLRGWVAVVVGPGDVEAYYWTWSRHLAGGYLDHGPWVAWLIRLGDWIGGGPSTLALRLPFILLSAATMWILALITARLRGPQASPSERWAPLWSLLLLVSMPMFIVAGAAANPDVPLLFWIALFIAAAQRALGGRLSWLLVAATIAGLACLAKYFGVLLVVPLVSLAWRHRRRALATVAALSTMALAAAPVILWNVEHGLASLRYHIVGRHAGSTVGPSLENLAKLVGGQLGYVQPISLVALLIALRWLIAARKDTSRPELALLLHTAAPLLALAYLLIGIVPGAEPHWPAGGYLVLCIAAGLRAPTWFRRRMPRVVAVVGLTLAALLAIAFHVHVLTDVGVRLMPHGYVPRFDLSNELVGWPQVADAIESVARRRRSRERPLLVAGCHYTTCAQLAFALRERRWLEVICPSPRIDQFDFFPGGDGASRRGVDLLYIRDERFPYDAAQLYRCLSTRELRRVRVRRAGRLVRRFSLTLCRGFSGLRASRWPPR